MEQFELVDGVLEPAKEIAFQLTVIDSHHSYQLLGAFPGPLLNKKSLMFPFFY